MPRRQSKLVKLERKKEEGKKRKSRKTKWKRVVGSCLALDASRTTKNHLQGNREEGKKTIDVCIVGNRLTLPAKSFFRDACKWVCSQPLWGGMLVSLFAGVLSHLFAGKLMGSLRKPTCQQFLWLKIVIFSACSLPPRKWQLASVRL